MSANKTKWLCIGLILVSTYGQAQTPQASKIRRIDRAFVCPESLPDLESKQTANSIFARKLLDAYPNITGAQESAYRFVMLRKHHCDKTLRYLNSFH